MFILTPISVCCVESYEIGVSDLICGPSKSSIEIESESSWICVSWLLLDYSVNSVVTIWEEKLFNMLPLTEIIWSMGYGFKESVWIKLIKI